MPLSSTDRSSHKRPFLKKALRVTGKVLAWLIMVPIILLVLVAILIYVPPIQDLIRNKAVTFLRERTDTYVALEHFNLRFPIGLTLEGFHINDRNGDTLVYAGALKANLSPSSLWRQRIVVSGLKLEGGRANIQQDQDSTFNFQFLADAFATPDTVAQEQPVDTVSSDAWSLIIEGLTLEDLRVKLDLEPSETRLDLVVGEFEVEFDDFSLDPEQVYLAEIVLKDTRVHLWMASGTDPPDPDTYPELENPMAGHDIRLQQLRVHNLDLKMKDVRTEDSVWVDLAELVLETRNMQLKEQLVELDRIAVDGLHLGTLTAGGETPEQKADTVAEKIQEGPPWLGMDDGFRYYIRDWRFKMDAFSIKNTSIAMHTGSIADPVGMFDPDHIVLKDIDLQLNDVDLSNDHIALMLERFSTRTTEHQPNASIALGVDARPSKIRLYDGMVSLGENDLVFQLSADPENLSSAYRDPEGIPIHLIASADIQLARLAPLLAQLEAKPPQEFIVDEAWDLDLVVNGTVGDLDTIRVDLDGDKGTQLHLFASVQGAKQWPNTTFRMDLDRLVMGGGMREILRGTLPPGTDIPQRLTMQGTASGSNGDLRADLAMDSDAGRIDLKGSATGTTKKLPDAIDLTVDVKDLAVQRFTGDTTIGIVSLDLRAKGSRLNTPSREGTFLLDPQELVYNGIDMSSLLVKGDVKGDSVDLSATVGNEAITLDLRARAAWPDQNDTLRMDFALLVDHLHLQDLGVADHPIGVSGDWRGTAAFSTDGMGRFRLDGDGVTLFNDERDLIFEEFLAQGFISADSTAFDLDSDALDLMYHTNIHPDSLMSFTTDHLMAIVEDDTSFIAKPNKRMELSVDLPRTEWLTEIVLPDLNVIQLDHLRATYDSDQDSFQVDMYLPKLVYQNIQVTDLTVDLTASDNSINGIINVEEIDRDSLRIERLSIEASTNDGALSTLLRMRDIENDRYRIGTVLRTIDDVRELRINEDLVLNSRDWTIHTDNVIRFPDDGPTADNFIMTSGQQRLALRTPPDHLVIELENFMLTTLTDLISTEDSVPVAAGRIDGEIAIPRGENALLAADLVITDLKAMGTDIGKLSLDAEETRADQYNATARLEHQQNEFNMKAFADLSGERPLIQAEGDLAFQDLSFLEPFVSEYLYALEGGLKGDISVNIHGDDTDLNGQLTFKNTGVGVEMTGVTYRLPDERITFDNEGIHFRQFALVDSAGNRFQLDGLVDQNAENGPAFDLRLRTDRFKFVNSTEEDNESFYGDLYTALDLHITGNSKDPLVEGLVSILEGTYLSIVLPGSDVEMISHQGIVVFTNDLESLDTLTVRSDSEIMKDSLEKQLPGIALDLEIRIDPDATFAIVLDPATGDAATVSAEADLNFRYGMDREMYLAGPLTIQGGGYTLNFYGLVKKEFELVKGGTVVWNGDPTKARIDVQARYVSRTSPYALVANATLGMSEAERNRLQQRLPFEVLIGVDGSIDKPEIEFGLDLPRMMRNSYPQVDNRLDQLSQPAFEEELNKQVFALLVLNSFIMEDPGSAPGGGRSLAGTAARNSVNNILSDQLNKLTGKYVKGVDISLGVNTYDQARGDEAYQRTSVDYQVSKRLLNDRLTFEVGGSIGVDEDDADVSNVSNTRRAQYAIMYDLTSDGRYRLRGFHENTFDLYDGEITRSGIAILYTKEFEENAKARQQRRERILERNEDGPILPPVKPDEDEQDGLQEELNEGAQGGNEKEE